jgi:hypothetical protein
MNRSFDFQVYYGMSAYSWGDTKFTIDPEHWSMVPKIQKTVFFMLRTAKYQS